MTSPNVAAVSKERLDTDRINASFSENALKMMKKRYLIKREDGTQETPAQMFERIALALADIEKNYGHDRKFISRMEKEFFSVMANKEYTPAGRSITNLGGSTRVVANCIVLPVLDSMESIFQTLKDAALLQQAGSGLGFDFSHLRPAMTPTKKSAGVSSGPVSFLNVYNEAFSVIKQQGRHGANMAMMQIDHPDILDFIRSKQVEGSVRNFNISVKVTDEFMRQLQEDPNQQWYCQWKGVKTKPHKVLRAPNGSVTGSEDIDISVKQLFDELVHYAWLNGEPGIVFIDEVNRTNPLPGLGPIDCSNPCGEQFLHHYDNCNLGSINLAEFVQDGAVDWEHLRWVTKTATRMMDNVIDTFDFPVHQVTDLAQKNRRIGLGIMGFADMLYQLGIAYNSQEGRALGEKVMKTITEASHEMSRELAEERGEFPNMPLSIFAGKTPMRNAALTTVAPTGSIAMMFDSSSGIEPNFALSFVKQDKDGVQYRYFNRYFETALATSGLSEQKIQEVKDAIIATGSIQNVSGIPEKLKKTFVVAMDISAGDHMNMQSSFQKNVDNSISKTINFPNSATHEEVADGFVTAWKTKCKSCTVYRDGSRTVQVLNLGTGENIKKISDLGQPGAPQASSSSAPIEATVSMTVDQTTAAGSCIPRSRPEVMEGRTYKVKTGYGNLYVTVNNDENGEPFEVFATIGKSGGFFQEQSEAICRLISLALRSGIKAEDVMHHLRGIRGPMPTLTSKGTILSLPDAIGQIISDHIKNTLSHQSKNSTAKEEVTVTVTETVTQTQRQTEVSMASHGMMPGCPDCGAPLQFGEGCMSCPACGFSRCM